MLFDDLWGEIGGSARESLGRTMKLNESSGKSS